MPATVQLSAAQRGMLRMLFDVLTPMRAVMHELPLEHRRSAQALARKGLACFPVGDPAPGEADFTAQLTDEGLTLARAIFGDEVADEDVPPRIQAEIFERPTGNIRGLINLFMRIKGEERRVAHCTLQVGKPAEVRMQVSTLLSMDEVARLEEALRLLYATLKDVETKAGVVA